MLDSFGQPTEDPPSGRAKVTYVTDGIELELTRVVDAPGVTHLHSRVNQTR
jgi:hypothetical protein